jgi:hypothetical protein
VEVHIRRLADVGDVAALHAQVQHAISRAGPGAVICADHRLASPLSREAADAWSRVMRQNNGSLALAGVLLDPTNMMSPPPAPGPTSAAITGPRAPLMT